MGTMTTRAAQAIIALALAGSLVVDIGIVPAIWRDLDDAPPAFQIALVAIVVLGVLTMQVFGVCVWRLLSKVRRGSVFSASSFRDVDVIIWMLVAAAVLAFALAVLLAPGSEAPGVIGLICGASLVLGGVALVVVVMKALLRQAIARDVEAEALRSELDEVV